MIASQSPSVFRFAPSPNGLLHLGHAYSALLNQKMARDFSAHMLLRIEDIDQARCSREFEAKMLSDLTWLGFEWAGETRRQSDHFKDYDKALSGLMDMGLVYHSFLTRGDVRRIAQAFEQNGSIWPRDPDGTPLFPGRAYEAQASSQDTFTLRLDMKKALALTGPISWQEMDENGAIEVISFDPAMWGDIVLARRDTPTSYHLAVVVDDADQGVSHIVRGMDLYEATSIHVVLQKLLGLPHPIYHHHRLILDDKGQKLSKSTNATSISALKVNGLSARDLKERVGL